MSLLIETTELISLTQNQTTKSNTYTKTHIIHQVSSGKFNLPYIQGYPPYLLTKKIFQETVLPYHKALQNSGYRHTLTYKRPKTKTTPPT